MISLVPPLKLNGSCAISGHTFITRPMSYMRRLANDIEAMFNKRANIIICSQSVFEYFIGLMEHLYCIPARPDNTESLEDGGEPVIESDHKIYIFDGMAVFWGPTVPEGTLMFYGIEHLSAGPSFVHLGSIVDTGV